MIDTSELIHREKETLDYSTFGFPQRFLPKIPGTEGLRETTVLVLGVVCVNRRTYLFHRDTVLLLPVFISVLGPQFTLDVRGPSDLKCS